jgi:hypothetical protein
VARGGDRLSRTDATLDEERITLKPRTCPQCKRVSMKDTSDTISDAFCGLAWCPQFRRVCITCDINVFGQHRTAATSKP